jgi:hypothetical protein
MNQPEFLKEQFLALRREIEARQARIFWTVVIGLLGMPTLTYLAKDADTLAWLAIPFLMLVIIILFLTEQNAMMRCGRFIREKLENHPDLEPGWESWLESRLEYRVMERNFIGCFIVIFFLYYFLAIGMALYRLWAEVLSDPSGHFRYWLYGALVAYAIGALWAILNLVHHWRFATSTSSNVNPDAHENR